MPLGGAIAGALRRRGEERCHFTAILLMQFSLAAASPPLPQALPPPPPPVLPSSSGRASRPGLRGRGHAVSTWSALAYTTQGGGGLLAVNTRQPRTGGDGVVCDTAEADCNGRPPAELSTRLCHDAHDAGAHAEIDLGTAAVLAAGNQIHVWGWNTRCEIECRFETPDGQGRVWRTDGGWQTDGHSGTGLYPLDACSGARTLVIRGGGHCGSCRVHLGSLRVKWTYAGPPFPPNAAPLPPPPWPPTPEAVVAGVDGSTIMGIIIPLGIIFLCLVMPVYNARRGCRERAVERARERVRTHGNGARSPPPPTPAVAVPAQLAPPGAPVVQAVMGEPEAEVIIVEGALVVEEPTQPPTAVAGLNIAQKAEVLRSQLGVRGTIVEVADAACRELGIDARSAMPVAERMDAALAALNGTVPNAMVNA